MGLFAFFKTSKPMSKTYRHDPEPRIKPRALKRLRQREAMQQYRSLDYPEREQTPTWKPMG